MPLVTLTVRKPKTPAFKAARLDGAHAAVAAGVPGSGSLPEGAGAGDW